MTREECIYYLGKVEYMDANEKEAIDMAIEALQEPKTIITIDPPYRGDKGIATLFKGKDDKLILEAFKELPSAEAEWIPCSERLPDLWDERYLVSLAWGGIGVMEYKSTGFHNYGSFSPVPIETVIAWMPLPEPYKEEEE